MADGCTGIPQWFARWLGIYPCCIAHDDAYGTPGTWRDKLKADWALAVCMFNKGRWRAAIASYVLVSTVGWFYWRKAQRDARERQPHGDVPRVPPESRAFQTRED